MFTDSDDASISFIRGLSSNFPDLRALSIGLNKSLSRELMLHLPPNLKLLDLCMPLFYRKPFDFLGVYACVKLYCGLYMRTVNAPITHLSIRATSSHDDCWFNWFLQCCPKLEYFSIFSRYQIWMKRTLDHDLMDSALLQIHRQTPRLQTLVLANSNKIVLDALTQRLSQSSICPVMRKIIIANECWYSPNRLPVDTDVFERLKLNKDVVTEFYSSQKVDELVFWPFMCQKVLIIVANNLLCYHFTAHHHHHRRLSWCLQTTCTNPQKKN